MEPFLGEIRLFTWSWNPVGWLLCDGSLQNIQTYLALSALLGTTYGGDGKVTFGLPDLRGRLPIATGRAAGGNIYVQGHAGGLENVLPTIDQIPNHYHMAAAYDAANANKATINGNLPGKAVLTNGNTGAPIYATGQTAKLAAPSITSTGGNAPHANMQPFLVLSYCIATAGIYPPRQ